MESFSCRYILYLLVFGNLGLHCEAGLFDIFGVNDERSDKGKSLIDGFLNPSKEVEDGDTNDYFGQTGNNNNYGQPGNNNNNYGQPGYNNNNNNGQFGNKFKPNIFGTNNNKYGQNTTPRTAVGSRFGIPGSGSQPNTNKFGMSQQEVDADKKKIKDLLERLKRLEEAANKKKELGNQGVSPKPGIDNGNFGNNRVEGNAIAGSAWKVLRKRKFFFQVEPVIPENDIRPKQETVYYLD